MKKGSHSIWISGKSWEFVQTRGGGGAGLSQLNLQRKCFNAALNSLKCQIEIVRVDPPQKIKYNPPLFFKNEMGDSSHTSSSHCVVAIEIHTNKNRKCALQIQWQSCGRVKHIKSMSGAHVINLLNNCRIFDRHRSCPPCLTRYKPGCNLSE